MASYHRLGTHVLAGELASDTFGKVHRGLTLVGSHFDRHKLVRTFSDELLDAGLGARLEEGTSISTRLAGSRCFLQGYHPETEKPAFVAYDHVGGRSLAQMIHKARIEQIPLGVDHALSVLQGLAQAVLALHTQGMSHGALSPSSVWVTYEGAALVTDAPYAPALVALLPRCPGLASSLAPYRPAGAASPLQVDVFALGAMLFELLTFEPLPAPAAIPAALQQATLKAAQEEDPIPSEIQGLLRRMLMIDAAFDRAEAFNAELERVLYDGDYSPTTFNMAFFMHTLFRVESEQDAAALKADEAADYAPLVATTGAQDLNVDTQKYTRIALFAAIPAVLLVGGLLWSNMSKNKALEEQNAKLLKMEEENKAAMAKLNEINTREANLVIEQKAAEERAKNAKSADDKKKAEQELKQIQEKKDETAREKARYQQAAAQIQQNLQAARSNPTAQPPSTQQAPTPGQPQPGQPAAQQARNTPPPPAPMAPPTGPVQVPQPGNQPPQPSTQVSVPQPVAATSETVPPEILVKTPLSGSAVTLAVRKAKTLNIPQTAITIRVQVFVDANGRPQQARAEPHPNSNLGLDDAAIEAAMASKFKPGTKDGKPRAQWFTVEYAVKFRQ